ncbi:MAG: methyltransferase domain-containing protein, partial [Oscillospiraceae bacterium]|nr:methyltransferase domain-containing protein [Oscillospiraceae bacterium]
MSKYNTKIDINVDNSNTIILRQIHEKSKVLEFGPADGYMTEYMKKELDCEVFIIELDKGAYENALQYAVGGICCNIESYEWTGSIQYETYDYIIFADVLEHLTNPQKALETAIKYLKPDGKILISIPNIAHNSIILDLLTNKFDYHDVGLLDNTHLKHFTYNTLNEMIGNLNLTAINKYSTNLFPQYTEFHNNYENLPIETEMFLKNKKYGSVYQFIYTCIKTKEYTDNIDKYVITDNIIDLDYNETCTVCVSVDSVFSEENTVKQPIKYGSNDVVFDLSDYNTNYIRLGITERPCEIKINSLYVNDEECSTDNLKGNFSSKIGESYIFFCVDPQFYITSQNSQIKRIAVNFNVQPQIFNKDLTVSLIAERDNVINKCKIIDAECSNLLYEHENALKIKEKEYKKKYEIFNKDLIKLENMIKNKDEQISALNDSYNAIKKSKSWRVTKPLRLFTTCFKLMPQGLTYLKRHGARKTLQKMKSVLRSRKVYEIQFDLNTENNQLVHNTIKYAIDEFILIGGNLRFKGWLFSEIQDEIEISLEITADNILFSFPITSRQERQDVYNLHKLPQSFNSGLFMDLIVENTQKISAELNITVGDNTQVISLGSMHTKIPANTKCNNVPLVYEREIPPFSEAWLSENVLDKELDYNILENITVDLVVPVYNGYEYFEALFKTIPKTKVKYRLLVCDDCSPDKRVAEFLEKESKTNPRMILVKNEVNLGFVRTVNRLIGLCENHIVLLNTDIELPENYLERMIYPVVKYPEIASVTPFSNAATILSIPTIGEDNPILSDVNTVDNCVKNIKPAYTEIPTGVGFCMTLNYNVVQEIGALNEVFG